MENGKARSGTAVLRRELILTSGKFYQICQRKEGLTGMRQGSGEGRTVCFVDVPTVSASCSMVLLGL